MSFCRGKRLPSCSGMLTVAYCLLQALLLCDAAVLPNSLSSTLLQVPSNPCFTNTTTQVWRQGTRSQALFPYLTMGCGVSSIQSAAVSLPLDPTCLELRLCPSSQLLPACQIEDKQSPAVRLMNLAMGKFQNVLTEVVPEDAACPSSAVPLIQVPGEPVYATLPAETIPDLAAGDNFTIAARIKVAGTSQQKYQLFSVNTDGKTRYISVYLINADLKYRTVTDPFNNLWVYFQTKQGVRHVEFQNVHIYDLKFHSIVVTVSNSARTISLYVDCQFIATKPMVGHMLWDPTIPVRIGGRRGSNDFNFNGVIDDLIIQQRLWTQEDRNCMCTDSRTGNNCGEVIEPPRINTPLQSNLTNNGRTLHLSGLYGRSIYEAALRSVVYRYLVPVTADLMKAVTFAYTDARGLSVRNQSSISIVAE